MKEILKSLWQKLFGDSVRAFGVVSLVFLASLAIAPAKNYFSEWRHYQHGYLKMIRNRSDAVTLQRRFEGGIQQIWLPDLGVVDRCTSCHVGLKEASLADVNMQPFRPHPVIPHKLDQFGCTICHRGQGAATTVAEAHSSTLAWEQPILPAKYIESSCGECHRGPLPGTPQLNQGRQSAFALRLRALPYGEAARRQHHEGDRRSAVSFAHRRQDHARVDLCLAERSASLRRHGDHAEFQAER